MVKKYLLLCLGLVSFSLFGSYLGQKGLEDFDDFINVDHFTPDETESDWRWANYGRDDDGIPSLEKGDLDLNFNTRGELDNTVLWGEPKAPVLQQQVVICKREPMYKQEDLSLQEVKRRVAEIQDYARFFGEVRPFPWLDEPQESRREKQEDTCNFICKECGKTFKHKRGLRAHQGRCEARECKEAELNGVEANKEVEANKGGEANKAGAIKRKLLFCTICAASFDGYNKLGSHMVKHSNERPFVCEQLVNGVPCAKAFKRKGDLGSHKRTHTGERPFQCPICGKFFSQSGNVGSHMRKVHKII